MTIPRDVLENVTPLLDATPPELRPAVMSMVCYLSYMGTVGLITGAAGVGLSTALIATAESFLKQPDQLMPDFVVQSEYATEILKEYNAKAAGQLTQAEIDELLAGPPAGEA